MKNRFTWKTVVQELLLLVTTIIMMIPVYYFCIGAFKERTEIIKHPLTLNVDMFTIKNFPYVIKKMDFFQGLQNTAIITVMAMLIIIIGASLAGYAIARLKNKLTVVYYSLMVSLMVIPFIGCVIPLVVLSVDLKTYGSLWGCILIQAAWNLPFATFLYAGFMQDIPRELEEAAYLDGCSTVGIYSRIFLPLLMPVTSTCCIRCGIGIWNDYLVSNSLLNSNRTPTLMVGVQSFFGQRSTEYGYAFASILLSSIPMIIAFLCLQKHFIKGIAAGAVKG